MPRLRKQASSQDNKMKPMISVHNLEGRISATIADKELTNKKLKEDKLKINLASKFYNWKERNTEEIKNIIRDSKLILFIGKESTNFALKERMINQEDIKRIQNIPFCHLMKL